MTERHRGAPAERDPFDTDALKDQVRYAPHLLVVRMADRMDQAMAEGRDPYPAFRAWQSALAAWAWEDPEFITQAAALDRLLDDVYRDFGSIPRLEYVAAWRPLYYGVMRRIGMFQLVEEPQRKRPNWRYDKVGRPHQGGTSDA